MDDLGENNLELVINEPQLNLINELTLVGQLLSLKQFNHRAITAVLESSWNLGPNIGIKPLGPNTVLCTFTRMEDKKRIKNKGPWAVKGATLSLQEWPPTSTIDEINFDYCEYWVQVHNLPPNRLNEHNAKILGDFIGKFLYIDPRWQERQLVSFLQLRVRVDTSKKLKSRCSITREDGTKWWIYFKYEKLSDMCYNCGLIDHTLSACPQPKTHVTDIHQHKEWGPWIRASYKVSNMINSFATSSNNRQVDGKFMLEDADPMEPQSDPGKDSDKTTDSEVSTPTHRQDRPPLSNISNFTLPPVATNGKVLEEIVGPLGLGPVGINMSNSSLVSYPNVIVDHDPESPSNSKSPLVQLKENKAPTHLEKTQFEQMVWMAEPRRLFKIEVPKQLSNTSLVSSILKGKKRELDVPETSVKRTKFQNEENQVLCLQHLKIQPQEEAADEDTFEDGLIPEFVEEEQVQVIRRRFLHVKGLARSKNRSVVLNEVSGSEESTASTLHKLHMAGVAGLTLPPPSP